MRLILPVLACAIAVAQPKPAGDIRSFLESFEAVLKRSEEAIAGFFTEQRDGLQLAASHSTSRPWSETVTLGLDIDGIYYVAPDVAVVYASRRQVGSLVLGRLPLAFVLVKRSQNWKIAMYRVRVPVPVRHFEALTVVVCANRRKEDPGRETRIEEERIVDAC